jgi:hypothetical protein
LDFKTTTRPFRHAAALRQASALLGDRPSGAPLHILEVGPGLAVKGLGRMLTPATPPRRILRAAETFLRRVPMPDRCFENYETLELLQIFAAWPVRLTLIDINPRVLRIIGANLRDVALDTRTADLSLADNPTLAALSGSFDVTVAFSILSRIPTIAGREVAVAHLRNMTRPGGLILANDHDVSATDCRRLADSEVIYRKLVTATA